MRYYLGNLNYELIGLAGILVITGNAETVGFCRDISDQIKKCNERAGDLWKCDTLTEFEEKARYPAFFGRWWYTGSADSLSPADAKALIKLIKDPVDYGTAILTGTDFTKYRKHTRLLAKAPRAHELVASFPSDRFLIKHVQREITVRGCKIAPGIAKRFIHRLGDSYTLYAYYIDLLISELPKGVVEVKKEHIDATLKGFTGTSFNKFVEDLLRPLPNNELKRSLALFKSYDVVREEGPANVLRKLHYRAKQYMEIRRLINEGYIPTGVDFTVAEFTKLLKDNSDDEETDTKNKKQTKFSAKTIQQWSDQKFWREVRIASKTTIADWYTIVKLSDLPYATDLEAEIALFNIMTRTQRTV